MTLAVRVVMGLIAGLVAGLLLSGTSSAASVIAIVEPIGTLWVNAIRMTVIPLVVSLVVTGVAGSGPRTAGRVGGGAVLLFAVMVLGSTAFGALAAPALIETIELDPTALGAVREQVAVVGTAREPPPFRDWLTGLVPTNPFRAAADDLVLPLIIFTAIFALGLTRVAEEPRAGVVRFFAAVADAMFVVVGWILAVAPIGVFGLILPLAARLGVAFAGAVGQVIVVICALLLVATAVLYWVAALIGRVSLRRFALATAPAQAVAFSTRSSLASLPALLEGAERRLELPSQVTGLVLPAAVAVFKYGSPIARITGTLFVARLYGIDLAGGEYLALVGAIGLLSFYSPGIPSGGLLVLAPLYLSFRLPVEGIGLLIAMDIIPDMFLTLSNVTADMVVAVLVARWGRGDGGGEPNR